MRRSSEFEDIQLQNFSQKPKRRAQITLVALDCLRAVSPLARRRERLPSASLQSQQDMCCQSGERAMQRRPPALSLPGGPHEQPPQEAAIALAADSPPAPLPLHFAGRNSQPEIFTFDLQALPPAAPAAQPFSRRPASRRPRRVLYPPSQSRRHRSGPQEERNPALRWLYLLCLLVFVQVCLEEAEVGATSRAAPALQPASPPLMLAPPSLSLQQQQQQEAQVHAPSLHRGMLELEAASLPGNLTCQALRGLIAVTL